MGLASRKSGGGLKSFRLIDVPLTIRLDAKEALLFGNGSADGVVPVINDPVLRTEIGMAADFPSNEVHWVSEKAWAAVMEPKPKPKRARKVKQEAA
jgi:hypothetical protein